jgi:hypothetical protein
VFSTTVAGSPALAAETIIAQTPQLGDLAVSQGVVLDGWAAFTVGTSGSAVRLRIRQTNVAGTVIADTGALTGGVAAAALVAQDISGVDTSAFAAGRVYVLTLQVTAGAAVSTVSGVKLDALAI